MTGAPQSALAPAGPEAEAIAALAWIMFGGGALITAVVIASTVLARHGGDRLRRLMAGDGFIVAAGVAFPLVVLVALLVHGLLLMGGRGSVAMADAVQIEVSGEQWWWRVRYPGGDDAADVVTANDIRIPVGRNVLLQLSSPDVIHSLWVPALAGKVDMIPGMVNRLRLRADRAGIFRGQCAEYCGGPHALMSFHVVALEPAAFDRWLTDQRRPARTAEGEEQRRGQNLFFATGCHGCHTVRGTRAAGVIGPDLTHVGSRLSIAAATLTPDAGSFARWIGESQHVKPNNRMPSFAILADDQRLAIGAWLESLR